MRKSLEERQFEEKKLLIQSLKHSNGGDMELTKIDYEFFQSSLAVMRTASMMPQSKRGRKMYLHDHLENLLDLAIAKTHAAGYAVSPIAISASDIHRIIYEFQIKYSKSKGKDGNKRIHVDSYETTGFSEEEAIIGLKDRLKRLKETLIEVKSVKKSHSIYIMKDGSKVNCLNVVEINGLENEFPVDGTKTQ